MKTADIRAELMYLEKELVANRLFSNQPENEKWRAGALINIQHDKCRIAELEKELGIREDERQEIIELIRGAL